MLEPPGIFRGMPVRSRSSAEACGSKQLGNRTHPEQRLLGGGSVVDLINQMELGREAAVEFRALLA
jgi:hypothetical protein